ncbi:MAG: TerC family protein, partial [Bacteroidota bacterium]
MLLSIFFSAEETLLFLLFAVIIILFLAVDLGVFNKKAHIISTKSALYQSIFWIVISVSFGVLIYMYDGGFDPSIKYFS